MRLKLSQTLTSIIYLFVLASCPLQIYIYVVLQKFSVIFIPRPDIVFDTSDNTIVISANLSL